MYVNTFIDIYIIINIAHIFKNDIIDIISSNTKCINAILLLTFIMENRRKTLYVDQRVASINVIEKDEKKSDVGRRFGLNPSTVVTIWKSKKKLLKKILKLVTEEETEHM